MNAIDWVNQKYNADSKHPQFKAGDQVKVHVKIKEGEKERVQVYEGVVIRIHRGGAGSSFTVRKVSYGVGVERIFPYNSPSLEKIEVVNSGKVRRAKLYYLRKLFGKKARIQSIDTRKIQGKKETVAKAAVKTEETTQAEPTANEESKSS